MGRLVQTIRVAAIFASILAFLTHMGIVWLLVRARWRRVRLSNRILSYYARLGLWVLRTRVSTLGGPVDGGALYVGNHLSYLDVLVISSVLPSAFVTSMEIKETPGLGLICKMAGCLFVERRTKVNLHKEIAELREGLEHGLTVAIFPEATSTNGEQILRFRRPLYLSAIEASRPVVPFCLNYRTVGGEPISARTRDSVCWYGDMDFVPHLWALAGCGGVEVDLVFQPALVSAAEDDPGRLAAESQASVEAVFRPISKSESQSPAL